MAVAPVREFSTETRVYATGSLAAHERATLGAKVAGRLQEIPVDLGSAVAKGDVIARVEKTDFEHRLHQAEAALAQARSRLGLSVSGEEDQAKPENTSIVREARALLEEATKNRERILRLRDQGILAEAELEAAESSFQVATNRFATSLDEARNRLAILAERQADLALSQQQLADTVIKAPFEGVVERRQASPGEYLQPASPVVTLVRVDPVRLRAEVPERDAAKIRVGQKVILQLEGSELVRTSKVSRLSPVISAENRMLLVEADFENPDGVLRPGFFAKANIVVDDSRQGLFVPQSAVVTFAGIQKVFTVENGKAVERQVTTGVTRSGEIEIVEGLEGGSTVVLAPGNLRDGQTLEIARRET